MFVSVIIPTINRPSLVRSVQSVLGQDFKKEEFEVIVVNDSGRPLTKAAWQDSPRARILESQKRNRCFARNAGATVAKGKYLLFLDDDDWLLPVAFSELWAVAQKSTAGWIYGAVNFLDAKEEFLAEHHVGVTGNSFVQMVGGDWIALTGSIIRSDLFFAINGFDPRYNMAEIHDINRHLAFRTELATTLKPVACVVRDRNNTSADYSVYERFNTRSRDGVLSQKGAFSRMRASVPDAYWAGKIVRSYLTCVHYNLKERNYGTALARSGMALAGLLLAGPKIFKVTFWRAILKQHQRTNVF